MEDYTFRKSNEDFALTHAVGAGICFGMAALFGILMLEVFACWIFAAVFAGAGLFFLALLIRFGQRCAKAVQRVRDLRKRIYLEALE